MRYDVAGAVGLSIDPAVSPRIARYVRGQMAPYAPSDTAETAAEPGEDVDGRPRAADVAGPGTLRIGLLQGARPAWLDVENSAGDGLTTAWDGERAFLLAGGRCCVLPDPLRDDPADLAMEPGFPISDVWASMVKPLLSLAALRRDGAVLHASAVVVDGGAVLVAGWSESGKTEVALALAEAGGEFLSDKWSILTRDGKVAPFPASVGVRRWVVPYLPRLGAGLGATARVQLAGARVAATVTRPLRDRRASGAIVNELSGLAAAASRHGGPHPDDRRGSTPDLRCGGRSVHARTGSSGRPADDGRESKPRFARVDGRGNYGTTPGGRRRVRASELLLGRPADRLRRRTAGSCVRGRSRGGRNVRFWSAC